jgi:hypothetical protein
MKEKPPHIADRESWLKVGVVGLFSCVAVYKIITTPFAVDLADFKFSDLLALILSLFAIALSMAFYFKATDTSNQFYDNTYKFTKEISEILGRIEAGFGERLRHLDEGYSGIRARFDGMPIDIDKAQKAFEKEKEVVVQKEKEQEKLIEELAKRAKLEENEKTKLFTELRDRELSLHEARRELSFLRERAEGEQEEGESILLSPQMAEYIRHAVIPGMGGVSDVSQLSVNSVRERFKAMREQLQPAFIQDCIKLRIAEPDGLLTQKGAKLIRRIARERR